MIHEDEYIRRLQDRTRCIRCQAWLDPDRPIGTAGSEYLGPVSDRSCTRECEVKGSITRYYRWKTKPLSTGNQVGSAGCIRAMEDDEDMDIEYEFEEEEGMR